MKHTEIKNLDNRIMGIYKIENLINGKVYIGQSVNIKKRIQSHINTSLNDTVNKRYPLHLAIRKYGVENFDFEIIKYIDKKEDLNKEENKSIKEYSSTLNKGKGYNIKEIENGISNLGKIYGNMEVYNKIAFRIFKGEDYNNIAKDYGVSRRTIANVNTGIYHKLEGYNYPIRKRYKKINRKKSTSKKNKKENNRIRKYSIPF